MSDEMHVQVSWSRSGFIATSTELRKPVIALSLAGLRRKIESMMSPDQIELRMHLDRTAAGERDRRRWGARSGTRDRPVR